MALTLYQLLTALVLLAVGLILLGWRIGKERSRPEAISAIAVLCLIGAVCFLVSRSISSPDQPNWIQSIAYTLRAIPYDAGLMVLSYFVIRSVGYKYPRTQVILSWSPTVFGFCWLSAFAFGIILGLPVLEEYRHFPPEFLLLKLRNIPELVWPGLTAIVFARELKQCSASSRRLLAQRASFLVASLGFVGLTAGAIWVNFLKVMTDTSNPAVDDQISVTLSFETISLGVAGLGWISGAIWDGYSEDEDWLADAVEDWIEVRHEIETTIDQQLGRWLHKGRGVIGDADFIDAFDQAAERLGYPGEQQEDGEMLLQLLAVLRVRKKTQLLDKLRTTQGQLAANESVAGRLLVKLDPSVRYDVSSDPLYKATAPALEVHENEAVSTSFHHLRPDHQLALLFAADLELLPKALNAAMASQPGQYVTAKVVALHREAKDDHQIG